MLLIYHAVVHELIILSVMPPPPFFIYFCRHPPVVQSITNQEQVAIKYQFHIIGGRGGGQG